MVSEVAGQGARPALRWTAVIGGLGGLEEGHYAAYIKGTPGEFMTDEDVVVFNGMKQAVSDFYGLSDVTDLPTHHLCCFAVFGLATLFTLDLFTLDLYFISGDCTIDSALNFLLNVIYNCFMAL
ncbi:hypothetical protein ACJX0J_036432 [Zea mays]